MAAKVALTAEEFRENSQRSIALFNTEKLSTDSTHVLKSAYCNSVHFCRCNLHGACGGKVVFVADDVQRVLLQSARGVWRQRSDRRAERHSDHRCNLHGACGGKGTGLSGCHWHAPVAICTGRVEAKVVLDCYLCDISVAICTGRVEAKGSGAGNTVDARSCNLHGACGGKGLNPNCSRSALSCNLHGACGGKVSGEDIHFVNLLVAICTGRVEDLASSPEKNPRKFMQTYCIFIHLGV